MDQLEGTLTARSAGSTRALFDLAARLEASLDFPDEGFHFITREDDARRTGRGFAASLAALVTAGRTGRVIREGRLVVLAGRPNVGKSSLFNALARQRPGDRDGHSGHDAGSDDERVDIGGIAVTLVDTAGLRETLDVIEMAGVERADGRAARRRVDTIRRRHVGGGHGRGSAAAFGADGTSRRCDEQGGSHACMRMRKDFGDASARGRGRVGADRCGPRRPS